MKIIPFIGFDNIKFGLSIQEVITLLGAPSHQQTEIEDDNSKVTELIYDTRGIEMTFHSNDNYRLGSISFCHKDHTLFDMKYITLSEFILLENHKNHQLKDLALEDHFKELNAKDYFSDIHNISIWVHHGIVEKITIFPQYDESGNEIIWPL